jgi:hypothetical protein
MSEIERQEWIDKCVNLDLEDGQTDKELWYNHVYKVYLCDGFVPEECAIIVNADNEQDALDIAVDYAIEQGWRGYYLDYTEDADYIAEYGPDGFDEITFAGNASTPIATFTIRQVF